MFITVIRGSWYLNSIIELYNYLSVAYFELRKWTDLILVPQKFKRWNIWKGYQICRSVNVYMTVPQALVSFKKYMPPLLPYFKVNICPFPLPHFASICVAYLWSFRWSNYIVTLPRYFSFRLPLWSKEEEGAYIFWMKQVPVDCSNGTTAGKNTLRGHFNIHVLPYNVRTSYNNNDIFVVFLIFLTKPESNNELVWHILELIKR